LAPMTDHGWDTAMRSAAFAHVRALNESHDQLTTNKLTPGFAFEGDRIPLVNPRSRKP